MVEEFIDIPYGRDHRENGTTIDERERSVKPIRIRDTNADNDLDNASDYLSLMSPRSALAGLSGLSHGARLKGVDDDNDESIPTKARTLRSELCRPSKSVVAIAVLFLFAFLFFIILFFRLSRNASVHPLYTNTGMVTPLIY
jgi:hypothetical protein